MRYSTHNSDRIRLDENCFSERRLADPLLEDWNAFPAERLQNRPVIEALVVGVAVDVGQHLAVDRSIAEADDNLWLQVLVAVVVGIERLLQLVWDAIVVRLREEPSDGGSLLGLQHGKRRRRRKREKNV